MLHISLLERANPFPGFVTPGARSRYLILAQLSNTLTVLFRGSLLRLAGQGMRQRLS